MITRWSSIEFFRFEKEMWYRTFDGENHKLTEEDRDIISSMFESIESMYPKAFAALKTMYYKLFSWSIKRYQFKVVDRFLRCNFSRIDNIQDISSNGCFNFEHVECPLRGVCSQESVICEPELETNLGSCEQEVMELLFKGFNQTEIAEKLGKSPDTVHNQIFRSYRKIGVREKADFIHYAYKNKLFKEE